MGHSDSSEAAAVSVRNPTNARQALNRHHRWLKHGAGAGVVGAVVAWLLFVLEGSKGYSYADEGFLWYGIRFSGSGSFPIRDFQAYAPGRYLAGAWLPGAESGPMASRVASYVALAAALAIAFWLLSRYLSSRGLAAVWFAVVVVAAIPWWKAFDQLALVGLAAAAVVAAEKQTPAAFAVHGATVGLAALIGLNHGLYAGISVAGVTAILGLAREVSFRSMFRPYAIGLGIGLLPLIAIAVIVPGFAAALISWSTLVAGRGANIPLPVPLPWRPPRPTTAGVLLGFAFLALPATYLAAAVGILREWLRSRRRSVAIGCLAVGVPYLHHAFSRADASHLAQSAFPALLLIAVVSQRAGWVKRIRHGVGYGTAAVSLAGALIVFGPHHPGISQLGDPTEIRTVNGDELTVTPRVADHIDTVERLRQRISPGDRILALPAIPGVYAELGVPSVVPELFASRLPTADEQSDLIETLESLHVEWIVIRPGAVGGNPDLAFDRAYASVLTYMEQAYRLEGPEASGWMVYRRTG